LIYVPAKLCTTRARNRFRAEQVSSFAIGRPAFELHFGNFGFTTVIIFSRPIPRQLIKTRVSEPRNLRRFYTCARKFENFLFPRPEWHLKRAYTTCFKREYTTFKKQRCFIFVCVTREMKSLFCAHFRLLYLNLPLRSEE